MDIDKKAEIIFIVEKTLDRVNEKLDEKLTRIHERIDPIVCDIGKINGRLSMFPTPNEIKEDIKNEVKECKQNHSELMQLAISKKDWLKIIGLIAAAILSMLGIKVAQ